MERKNAPTVWEWLLSNMCIGQEHILSTADGDTPGVTVSFVSLDDSVLRNCLAEPTDENRKS